MNFEEIKHKIIEKFSADIIVAEQTEQLQPSITVDKNRLVALCEFLRKDDQLYFDYLNCLSGVDYGLDKNELGVVYHISSIPYRHSLVLKIIIPFDRTVDATVHCPSVSGVWRSADWHEREAYDMYGMVFDGHPDMRRILCPDDWEGYPLRKDYVAADVYQGLKINFERNND